MILIVGQIQVFDSQRHPNYLEWFLQGPHKSFCRGQIERVSANLEPVLQCGKLKISPPLIDGFEGVLATHEKREG